MSEEIVEERVQMLFGVYIVYDRSKEGARDAVMQEVVGASWKISGNHSMFGYSRAGIVDGSGKEVAG